MLSSSGPVSVLVSAFEDLVDGGLRALIERDPSLELAGAGVPVAALDREMAEREPKVCILNFGALRSAADIHRIAAAHPTVRLVVLANHPSPSQCSQILSFGATACLGKEVQARDILNAVHLASRGLHVIPRSAPGPALPETIGPELLTARETDVLDHLGHGQSNAEIAQALCVSVETVRTHRRNIYRKLGVRTRRELAALLAS